MMPVNGFIESEYRKVTLDTICDRIRAHLLKLDILHAEETTADDLRYISDKTANTVHGTVQT